MLLSRRQAVGVSEVERQATALVPGGTSAALGWGLVTEAALKGSERSPVGRHVKIEAESVFSAPLLLEVSQAQCLLSIQPTPHPQGTRRQKKVGQESQVSPGGLPHCTHVHAGCSLCTSLPTCMSSRHVIDRSWNCGETTYSKTSFTLGN